MRTTIEIDDPVLRELKLVGQREGKSLGRVVSDLLAVALAGQRQAVTTPTQPLEWIAKPMAPRINLADRDALYDAMEQEPL